MRIAIVVTFFAAACSRSNPPVAVADTAERPVLVATMQPIAVAATDTACAPSPISNYEMSVRYCAEVASDPCCGTGGGAWVCNNARYVDWYLHRCPNR